MSKTLLVTIFVASSLMSRVVVAQDYTLAIATNRFTVGESVYVAWSTPPWSPGFFDWVGLYHASANDFNWVSYKYTLFRFDDTYFTVEEAGEYNFRYFVDNVLDKRATSSNFWVWPPAADLSLVRNYPSPPGPIIAFGDSLTAGVGASAGHDWPAIVSATLGIDIQNAGVAGDTTADALLRMGRDVLVKRPSIVVVLLGGNDFLRSVPAETTAANLKTIVARIQNGTGAVVVLAGVQSGYWGDSFASVFRRLADETGAVYAPDVLRGIVNNPFLSDDLLHPNDAGYAVVANRIAPAVAAVIPPPLAIKTTPNSFLLTWFGRVGENYGLQFAGAFPDGPWIELVLTAGTDKFVLIKVRSEGKQGFFRIMKR